jgi:hypothetical protein
MDSMDVARLANPYMRAPLLSHESAANSGMFTLLQKFRIFRTPISACNQVAAQFGYSKRMEERKLGYSDVRP